MVLVVGSVNSCIIRMFNMGNTQSIEEIYIDEVQRVLQETDMYSASSDSSAEEYVTDANETFIEPSNIRKSTHLSFIEKQLNLDEKISLTYILYSDAMLALDKINELIKWPDKTEVLSTWQRNQTGSTNNEDALLEALCIIQNYEVIKHLTHEDKQQLIARFLPRRKHSCMNVCHFRKVLYLICEDMLSLEANRLIDYVRNELGLKFIHYNANYLEEYLLHWEIIDYISKNDVSNLRRAFKYLKLYGYYNALDDISLHLGNDNWSPNKRKYIINTEQGMDNNICTNAPAASSSATVANRSTDHLIKKKSNFENSYRIKPDAPGLCLIINQLTFHKEFDKKYGPFPPNFKKLEDRLGSEKDGEKLKSTFEAFDFKVITCTNVIHVDILKRIEEAAMEATNYSYFFVCILSHGKEGQVYGANSLLLPISQIYDAMNKVKCEAKVLIIQACQGNVCQEVEDDLQMDCPSSNSPPSYRDMLVFWATVPGYAAIRDPKRGSWFIQTLCDLINETADSNHFSEICTLVKNAISNKHWEKNDKKYGIVPIVYTTLKKFLYFPPKKN